MKKLKRNRAERRDAVLYKLVSIFREESADTLVVDDTEHYIEGELEDRIIISVPEATSQATVEKIQEVATQAFNGRPVLVVTHNVEFMRPDRLSRKEAAEVIKKVEADAQARMEHVQAAAAAAAAEVQPSPEEQAREDEAAEDLADLRRELLAESGSAVGGDGGGPGDSVDGDSGAPVAAGDEEGQGAPAGPGEDAEDVQEGSHEAPGGD